MTVKAQTKALSAKKGTFSSSNFPNDFLNESPKCKRRSGQKSKSSKTHGKVTIMGLLMRPKEKKISAQPYQALEARRRSIEAGFWVSARDSSRLGFSAKRAYAHSVSNQKKALKTSLRSATQATDSTCKGCHANSAATHALRQSARVIRRKTRKTKTLFAA